MTNQTSAASTASAKAASEAASAAEQPVSQGGNPRRNWPAWAKQLPSFADPKPESPDFQLIDPDKLKQVLKDSKPETVQRIQEDIAFMDHELLRLFRECDWLAKLHQNRYRVYQIGYILLAALATLFGSLQSLAWSGGGQSMLPWFAFIETIIALLATFLATISGREPPMQLWLENRRKAESLRREYFRYLMNLEPYNIPAGADRRRSLSRRAAEIYKGYIPEDGK